MAEKHFIDPVLLKTLGELWEWFETRPDLTRHYVESMRVEVNLNEDTLVRFYEDGIEFEVIPVGDGNV